MSRPRLGKNRLFVRPCRFDEETWETFEVACSELGELPSERLRKLIDRFLRERTAIKRAKARAAR